MSRSIRSRELLAERSADLDDAPLDDGALGETIALVEGARQWARSTARELRTAAPGAAQGALTGFLVGGPAGAAVGAVAGGMGQQGRQHTAAMSAAAPGVENAAAVQLLGALLRPETMQALGALALGRAGAPSVPVLGTRVPVTAFANLLATLATQAAARHHQTVFPARTARTHLPDRPGVAAPETRAEALLALLAEAAAVDEEEGDAPEVCGLDRAASQRDLADLDRLEAE